MQDAELLKSIDDKLSDHRRWAQVAHDDHEARLRKIEDATSQIAGGILVLKWVIPLGFSLATIIIAGVTVWAKLN